MNTAENNSQNGNTPTVAKPQKQGRGLIKEIFQADLPEKYIRSVPAQSLYLAVKQQGLSSSVDVISIATYPQCRTMMDFDLWKGDRFHEDNFWEWLELPDQEEADLSILLKVIRSIDLKLVALILGRYVDSQVFEEATDQPPAPHYYTPDKGSTWIGIQVEEEQKCFLLGRLLAFVFENDTELFYQLLAVPNTTTLTVLEDEALTDKSKRLSSEGIPDEEYATEIHTPLTEMAAREALASEEAFSAQTKQTTSSTEIEATFRSAISSPEPLQSLSFTEAGVQAFESELSAIMNAALVFFRVDVFEYESVSSCIDSAKGILNIGLERASALAPELPSNTCYSQLQTKGMYQLGLGKIFELRKLALKCQSSLTSEQETDPRFLRLLDGLTQPIPVMPEFMDEDGGFLVDAEGVLAGGFKAVEHLKTVNALERSIKAYSASKLEK